MKAIVFAGLFAVISSQATAQTFNLATPTGFEVNGSVAGYKYVEPGDLSISIHGAKFAGEFTGTFSINKRHHWFGQGNLRASGGSVTYDGWCLPFLIAPNNDSPNGWELGLGDASPCSETRDSDWYVETRGLVGKDFIGHKLAWSPYSGIGFRYLSNGTTGIPGYRTDKYLYVPLGITARTLIASHHVLGLNLEFDPLIHGWQTTLDSALGGGDVPATPIAPAFTVNGFTDVSFDQHSGWALRASGKYQLGGQWSVEPYYIHWNVNDSPVSDETATFTVNGVTAMEVFGAFEPHNTTNEFGVKFGFRF